MVAQREKFGKLVLLELTETTGLGPEYRAAKLGPAGLEKIVTILRLSPGVSGNAEVARSLMDQAKVAAQLQNGNILKIFGIGKVDQTYYISYEFVEGKSLRAVLDRCRQESFPLQVEHALLITSKVCSALEYAQTRKGDNGRYFHGLVNPGAVLVTYEGEVRVKGFGYWPSRVREVLGPEELRYIAPEQRTGVGEPRSDIFGVGAVLFECLTGAPPPTDGDPASQVAAARLLIPQGDDDKIPAPVAEILRKSLAADPAARYPDVQDMRKALDTLLFSGDFTPTTFNLAFFMHSLYREDIEREAKRLKEDREASYLEFLTEEPGRPAPAPPARPVAPAPPPPKAEAPEPRPAPARAEAVASAPAHVEAPAPHPTPGPSRSDPHHGAGSREAASAFTFHKDKEEKKSGMGLVVPLALLVLLGGGAAYYFLVMKPAAPAAPAAVAAPPTVSPETAAAQARIQELEDKLKALEEEKAQAEAKAADDAKKKVEAQAAARGQAVDPEAIERAQEEARRKAKAEQEKRQLEETRRLEEQKRAEEQRIADERKRAEDQARAAEQARQEQAAAAAAAAAATPPPTEAPSTPAPVKAGTLVSLNDPGVVAPVVERQPTLVYPPIALRQRVDGTVELNALVDEKGNVADVAIVTPAGGRAGLNEAATESVKRRKYRPATKDGVPVRVWIQVRVRFELPK
jgi:TonB family protein